MFYPKTILSVPSLTKFRPEMGIHNVIRCISMAFFCLSVRLYYRLSVDPYCIFKQVYLGPLRNKFIQLNPTCTINLSRHIAHVRIPILRSFGEILFRGYLQFIFMKPHKKFLLVAKFVCCDCYRREVVSDFIYRRTILIFANSAYPCHSSDCSARRTRSVKIIPR